MSEWEKLTHREHILRRPDTYLGSGGVSKIVDEILVNAFDEYTRDPKNANEIRVEVQSLGTVQGPVQQPAVVQSLGTVRVSNNKHIPVIVHPKEKIYVPELIFGHLLTSSNYDDSKERYTGGRNGYGAKLTNIFSKRFTVTIQDPENSLEYTQTWRDNMSVCEPPKIKKYSKKKGWTHIEFEPALDGLDPEWIRSRCTELGFWGPKVFFGDQLVSDTFESFAKSRLDPDQPYAYMKQGSTWEVIVARALDGEGFKHYSYVNGIATTIGGTHVNHVVETVAKILGHENRQVRPHLHVFVKALLDRPSFSSQEKTECTSKVSERIEPKPKFSKDVVALGISDVLAAHRLKKSDGVKKSRVLGIPKLDDANWAGTPKSDECTLILTEGDSAKALAIAGLSVVGRDRYGVFPLKGKPKNVRDASAKQLESNTEFSNLKKILGLKQGEIYKNTRSLRYGHVVIMTDADLDGSHIKGLVLNMFHVFWPSLIELGYIRTMVTPVVKASNGKWFFTEEEFRASCHGGATANCSGAKYYKGLGTSTSAEAKEYFRMLDRLLVEFKKDPKTDTSMQLAFAKDHVPNRKEWLLNYMALQDKPYVPYGNIKSLSITDFIHKDQIRFSEEDIHRSIPHVMDGLKPSQRKVIHACLKKNLEKDMTVAQLAGYIGEHTAYHHGEASLHGTIVGLAQDFVGSNNLNLLVPSGQFGSRLEGGKDHASARYISTRLSPWTRKLFDEKDSPVLNWLKGEDGRCIEPEFFVPVLPMVLVNGCEGIGTGFSTYVPPYNPEDIKANLKRLLRKEPLVSMTPWFRGFKGKISRGKDEKSWILEGVYKPESKGLIRVTELPPGKWIQDYKEYLDGLVESGKIKGYENHSTETDPNFLVSGEVAPPTTTIHTSNMYLVTPGGSLKKYETPEEILIDYAKIRLGHYKLRKKHMCEELERELKSLDDRARFIELVIEGRIEIFRKSRASIVDQLNTHKLPVEECLSVKTYMYTLEETTRLRKMIETKREELRVTKETSVACMWENDLDQIQW